MGQLFDTKVAESGSIEHAIQQLVPHIGPRYCFNKCRINTRFGTDKLRTNLAESEHEIYKYDVQATPVPAQRFLDVHAAVCNLFKLGRHLVSAKTYKLFRLRVFVSWEKAAAI